MEISNEHFSGDGAKAGVQMKLKDLPKKHRKQAKRIMKLMTPIPGEIRTIEYCEECNQVMGARFIPGGLGSGLRVNQCLCRLTGNDNPRKQHTLKTKSP